jgi:hypothetical protein
MWAQQDDRPILWIGDGVSVVNAQTAAQRSALNRVWATSNGMDASAIWTALGDASLITPA